MRRVAPSSTPEGISTVKVRSSSLLPSPRQSGHGEAMTSPRPLQRPHGVAVTIWPSIDWRTRWIWPEPRHSGQVLAVVPSRAPLPSQVVHVTGAFRFTSRRAPKTTSFSPICRTISASAPWRRPPRCAPPPKPWLKKASKRSPRPPAKPNVSAPARSRASHGFGPEHVVATAPLRIAQGLVGDGDLLEARL